MLLFDVLRTIIAVIVLGAFAVLIWLGIGSLKRDVQAAVSKIRAQIEEGTPPDPTPLIKLKHKYRSSLPASADHQFSVMIGMVKVRGSELTVEELNAGEVKLLAAIDEIKRPSK
jgi:hypothetical protein